MEYVTVTIDGREVEIQTGETIMDAADKLGAYLPCLCSHPDLEPIGLCRLSIVEVDGWDSYPLASVTPAEEGMIVTTKTPELQKMRRSALEMMLALTNHPTECLFCERRDECQSVEECLKKLPISAGCKSCPQDGECEIQRIAAYVGLEKVRFSTIYRDIPVIREPFFDRDYNLCILCSRCARVCSDVRGENVIVPHPEFHQDHWIGPKERTSLVETTCKFCGACVDACPTGALTARFESKEQPENSVTTTCPHCGIGCQIEVGVKDNEIVRVRGKRENTVNNGQLCVKGRFGLHFATSPDRLKTPLIKQDGEFKPATWEQAMQLVTSKFKELKGQHGSDVLGGIASGKTTNEEDYLFQKFIRVCLGTNNVEFCTRLCHAATGAAMGRALGAAAMTNSLDGFENTDVILLIGLNLIENAVVFGTVLRNLVKKNKRKLIVVDPRRIALVDQAELWLRPRPGTDVALLNAMANVIIHENLADHDFVDNRTAGFTELKMAVSKYSPEKAEEITGVPREEIIEAAKLYAGANRAAIMYGMGLAHYTHGTDNISALCNIALLTGNLGKAGTGINGIAKHNNGQGAGFMGCMCNIYPGGQPVGDPKIKEKFEKAWGEKLSIEPGVTETHMLLEEDRIRGLYIMGGNPARSGPNVSRIEAILKRMDFLVVQDIFLTETAQLADVVLPAACLLEKDGTVTTTDRRITRVRKILDPPGQAQTDGEIICELGKRMGYQSQFFYENPAGVMDEIARLTPSYGGINYERLEQGNIQVPCPNVEHAGTPYLFKDGFPIGRGKFFPVEYGPPAELPDKKYPFILTTGSNTFHMRTGTMLGKIQDINAISGSELLQINPDDAFSLGIRDNDMVEISSRRGSLTVAVEITDSVPDGVLFMTYHFSQSPANVLTNSAYDPISKVPEFKYCAVKLAKIEG